MYWSQIEEQLHAKLYNYLICIHPMQTVICLAVCITAFIIFVKLKDKTIQIKTIVWCILCSLWFTVALEITAMGRLNNAVNTWNTVFSSFYQLVCGNYGIIYDIVFNAVLFLPFGFLINIKFPVRSSIVIVGLVSLLIELTQLITHRGLFEICDLVSNIIGGIAGIMVLVSQKRLYRIFNEKKNAHSRKTAIHN